MSMNIAFLAFPYLNKVASYNLFGRFSPSVWKNEDGSYGIRIYKCIGQHSEWDYFELDNTGLIISSPRGLAKQFNKKVRIADMDAMVEEYKDKVINQSVR